MRSCFIEYKSKEYQRSFGLELQCEKTQHFIKVKVDCLWTAELDGSNRFLPPPDDKEAIESWFGEEIRASKSLQQEVWDKCNNHNQDAISISD